MLNLGRVDRLASILGTTSSRLVEDLSNNDGDYQEFTLHDPDRPNKQRGVLSVSGKTRRYQVILLRNVLVPRLTPSCWNYGSVKGRSILDNARVHAHSKFLMKADISNFFPSIDRRRIYRLFQKRFKCSPEVSRLCTKLCTYNHKLSLGLVTSPFLADQVLWQIDERISSLCRTVNLKYSRFVDDITVSGPFDLSKSGIPLAITEILLEHGLSANSEKWQFSTVCDGLPITGVRMRPSGLDVAIEFVDRINQDIQQMRNLASNIVRSHHCVSKSQLMGRCYFIKWINPGRGKKLLRAVRAIDWPAATRFAETHGLVVPRKRLIPLSQCL